MRSGELRIKEKYISEIAKLFALTDLLSECGEMRPQLLNRIKEAKGSCIHLLCKVPDIVFVRKEYKNIHKNVEEQGLKDIVRFYACYFINMVKRILRLFMR